MQTFKKPISILLSLVMILSVFTITPVRTHAQTEGDWVFTTFGQGSVINQYTGSGGDVTVPDSLGNDPVISIDSSAFEGKTITSIVFPKHIKWINQELMKNQSSLTQATIPDGVEAINRWAFQGCSSLSEITIPDSVLSIADKAFDGCTSLSEVTIPDSVTQFGEGCFPLTTTICCSENSAAYTWFSQRGYNVRVLEHQHELSYVPASAPTQNSNGCKAHWYCSKCGKYFSDANGQNEITDLTQVLIPYFEFEYSNDPIDNGARYYKLIGYNGSDEDITIPTVIPDYYPDPDLRGKTVTVIREDAFKGNTTIKNVTIPDSITHVGSYSFMGCSNLTEVTIGKGLDHFGLSSFDNCPELEKVTIYSKRSDFSMRNSAFANSDKATVYGYHGTKVEQLITSYNIPFVSLGHAYGEPEWSWSDDLSSATAKFTCFKNDDTQTVTATVTSEVTKEPTADEPGVRTYTATVTFEGETYTDEETEEIPETNRLEHRVRTDPTADSNGWIEHWYRPSTGKYYFDASGETELTEAEVFIPYFTFEYSNDGFYKLTGYNGKDEDVVIPVKIPDYYPDENLQGKDFKIIREGAFQNNTTIKTVTMPDTIDNVADDAFHGCSELQKVTIGTGVTFLGNNSFEDCPKLTEVTIYAKDNRFTMSSTAFDGTHNVTVYGYHDTKVEEFMNRYSVPFVGLEHTYGAPELSWSDDNSSATFKFTCVKGDVSETVDAEITSEITKAATCTEEGEIKYTATADFEGTTYIYEKIENLPRKHALQHKEKVYPTVEEHGNKEYWYCPECKKYFKDANGEQEIPEDELNDYLVLPYFTFGEDDGHIKLISYNGNDESVLVPDKIPNDYPDESLRGKGFKIIREDAFKGNSTIRNVIMLDNIGHIGGSAFENCENLTEITVGTNLDYIGEYCFKNSPNLNKITIYSRDSEFNVNNWAFDDAGENITVYGYRNTEVENKIRLEGIPFVPLDPDDETEIQDVTYSVDKTWDIDHFNKDKPGSIQVVLQRKTGVFSWKTLQLVTLDESNHWRTEFDAVPSGYEVDADNIQAYEYRIRELGPKKSDDPELDPSDDDFQEKVKERLIYDTWDYDRPVIKQLIRSATNPEVLWQFEPSIDWVKGLAKTTLISPPFVTFEIDGYNDTVKDVPKHTTKYMVTYEEDKEVADKINITNLAVMDTAIYKRWLNYKEGEKPDSVYLMLESKAQSEYAEHFGLTQTNFYTPSFDAVVGSLNYADIPISGETLRGMANDVIGKTMGGDFNGYITETAVNAAIDKYFKSGLTVGKATPDSLNPLTRWRVKFTVKKYGTAEKLPMDFAGAELVTGIMEMVIDALIHQAGAKISIPVMYEPFEQYWSIKGFALSLLHDYELTCNVINIKFHPGEGDPYDGDPDDPDRRSQQIGGTKYWRGDNESDRPESIQLHVYYKDGETEKEVQGSPVTVTKDDYSNEENGWVWSLKIPVGSPDRDKDYYIREDVPAGYAVTYRGLDLINSKSQTEEPTEEETEEPTQSQTEPPTEVATQPPTEAVTEPATEVMTEPPTTAPTQPHHDDDDDDDDDPDGPGGPIIPIPPFVPVVPVVPTPEPGPDTPDQPDKPTQAPDPDKPTETPEPTQPEQPTQATEAPTEAPTVAPTEPADTLVVTKNWVGDTAEDRPDNIKIHVYYLGVPIKDSPITLKKSDFADSSIWISKPIQLQQGVKRNALIYYEEFPDGYQYKDNYAPTVFGSIITNTWQQTNIIGTKTWVDGNNILGKRPDKITVNLLADGEKVAFTTISASDHWQYRFTNKPIYKTENGSSEKINYTVEEDPVSGYTATYDGYDITNTLTELPSIKGSYKFTHTDRYGVPRTKTVEVTLNDAEILGYSGNNNQPGVPTYLWTEEAKALFDNKNPLVKAALAVTGNDDDQHQQDVSVYKNDVVWDLVKTSADDATNMTAKSSDRTLEVFATTKPYTFTFNYYLVKDGNKEYKGTKKEIAYGKPVTFDPVFSDPDQYVYIDDTIPKDGFCYWSADEAGLMPITTNRTFGMLMRGDYAKESDKNDRIVTVYAQYQNNLTDDWKPLIEESTFTHMISDEYDWVYLDYMVNYLSKDGKIVQDMVADGDQNIRYGLIAVKHPDDSDVDRNDMIEITQAMIGSNVNSAYTDSSKQSVAYRFEYGKPTDSTKPISNFNRVLYTLRSDTEKAQNKSYSVIAYITVDGKNYFYSEVNNDINVNDLLKD